MPEPPPGETAAHESHVSTLRPALMLLKLMNFLTSIKYEAAGVHNAEDMLWPLLSDMLLSYQPVAAHENRLQETYTEEQVILVLLLQMLVFQASQLIALRQKRDVLHATMALRILKSLMMGLHYPPSRQLIGAKMLKSGTQSTKADVQLSAQADSAIPWDDARTLHPILFFDSGLCLILHCCCVLLLQSIRDKCKIARRLVPAYVLASSLPQLLRLHAC